MITPDECALFTPGAPDPNDFNRTTFKNINGAVQVLKQNAYSFAVNSVISKYTLLWAVKFKFDHAAATSYIMYDLMGMDVPYARIGGDYYKIIEKENRYGGTQTQIKPWKKDEIKQDHSKSILHAIPKYDDFIILPSNTQHQTVKHNCYNLYSKFAHTPHHEPVTEADIPVSIMFLKHIFGNHFDIGTGIYMKVLYEHPRQILPILTLVSKERDTGKTTFINWIQMIFGDNYTLISPDDLTKTFNAAYASKNIIAVEETFVEKQAGVEKLKYLSTGKTIKVSQKFVSEYDIPLFAKVILCTNKVKDFMKIDDEEIRFWIRHIPVIKGKKNTLIEQQLFDEIPKFLRYMTDLPPINFDTGSRMVLTKEQIYTEALNDAKHESRSWLYKEIEILICDVFDNNPDLTSFMASLTDIKEKWFLTNQQVTRGYIRKVLQDEAGLIPQCSPNGTSIRYSKFGEEQVGTLWKTGTPYEFFRTTFPDEEAVGSFL